MKEVVNSQQRKGGRDHIHPKVVPIHPRIVPSYTDHAVPDGQEHDTRPCSAQGV